MTIWICRAGKGSIYVEDFLKENKIFCTWDGFNYDLNEYKEKEKLKERIRLDKCAADPTAINTWTGQLICIRDLMQKGDIVLTPNKNSKSYNVGIISGNYYYDSAAKEHFYHSREVKWLPQILLRDTLPKYMIYSLGAYRTIFRLKYEEEFMKELYRIGISEENIRIIESGLEE